MKKITSALISAFIFIAVFTNAAYAQWTQSSYISQLGIASTNNFYVCVPDGRGWVALGGDNGWIVNSTSSGIAASNTIYNPIKAISFINNSMGVAYANLIATSTTNGGDVWSGTVNMQAGGTGINDVEFINSTGFACGNTGVVRKYVSTGSYPGWLDWQNQTLDASINFTAINTLSATHAFAVGNNGKIYRTLDGSTWTNLPAGTAANLRDVSFRDSLNGIAIGEYGTMLITSDGGTSWNLLPHYSALHFNSVKYLSNGSIYIAGDSGLILKSLNNGTSWGTQNSGTVHNLNSICAVSNTMYIAGNNGTFLYSSNGGGPVTPVNPIASDILNIANSSMLVYPNPTTGIIRVDPGAGNENARLVIYNTSGELIFSKTGSFSKTEIDLTEKPAGTYFLSIRSGNREFIQKIRKD
jgi:photosystem II stability/assembly factor-like uncharacterized protein